MVSNASVQMGTMSWSDLYPMSGNLSPSTSQPQTGASASGGTGVVGGQGLNATHWIVALIVVLVVFRFVWEHNTMRA
jgi:hypothetical protein